MTAFSNSWNRWVSLIFGFLSRFFFRRRVSTSGLATIPCTCKDVNDDIELDRRPEPRL